MSSTDQLAQDLEQIRAAVERQAQPTPTPALVPVMWAALILIGCVLNDVAPERCWIFWLCAPPVAFMLSAVLGGRRALQIGQYNHEDGIRQSLHWSSIWLGAIPVVLLAAFGKINGWQMGQLFFLISGMVYYLAGVHFERRYLAPGVAMIAAAGILTAQFHWIWTIVGVLISATLLVSFVYSRRATHA